MGYFPNLSWPAFRVFGKLMRDIWGTDYFYHKFQPLKYQHHTKQITQDVDLHLTTWCQLTHLLKYSVGIQWPIVCPERHSCWQTACISSHWQKGWSKWALFTVEMFSLSHIPRTNSVSVLLNFTYLDLTSSFHSTCISIPTWKCQTSAGTIVGGIRSDIAWNLKVRKTVFWDSQFNNYILKTLGQASLTKLQPSWEKYHNSPPKPNETTLSPACWAEEKPWAGCRNFLALSLLCLT